MRQITCLCMATVLMLGLATQRVALPAEPALSTLQRTLSLPMGKQRRELQVYLRSSDQLCLEQSGECQSSLESAAGAILTYRFQDDYLADPGGYTSRYLEVRLEPPYRFDLQTHVDRSGQAGRVLAQMMRGQGCPDPKATAARQGSYAELAAQIRSDTCGYLPETLAAFALFDWNPSTGEVTLDVEAVRCINTRSVCDLETRQVALRPPAEWREWLDSAKRGEGLLVRDRERWLYSLSEPQTRAIRVRLQGLRSARARRQYIADHVFRERAATYTAGQLLEEFFPVRPDVTPDAETQLAWSDLLLYQAYQSQERFGRCLDLAKTFYGYTWERKVARMLLATIAYCTDGTLASVSTSAPDNALLKCRDADDPMRCSQPLFEQALQTYRPERRPSQ